MNSFENINMNKKRNYATNAYILNVAEVYKDCISSDKKYLYTRPEPVYAKNCEPRMKYMCPVPNDIKCWNQPTNINRNDLVWNNIRQGGVICDFKPRTNINTYVSSRFLTGFVRPPCDYVKDIETEFYLQNGENSSCSKYWKDRHAKSIC